MAFDEKVLDLKSKIIETFVNIQDDYGYQYVLKFDNEGKYVINIFNHIIDTSAFKIENLIGKNFIEALEYYNSYVYEIENRRITDVLIKEKDTGQAIYVGASYPKKDTAVLDYIGTRNGKNYKFKESDFIGITKDDAFEFIRIREYPEGYIVR